MIRKEERLCLEGAITLANVAGKLNPGFTILSEGARVVDLTQVTEVDSAALSLLLEWIRQAKLAGFSVRIENLPAGLTSLATLYGVSDLLA